jgi:hypothetical protein
MRIIIRLHLNQDFEDKGLFNCATHIIVEVCIPHHEFLRTFYVLDWLNIVFQFALRIFENSSSTRHKGALTDMGKPGPKPQLGETRHRRSIRLTDECFAWCQSLGGPGVVLETLFRHEKAKPVVERLMQVNLQSPSSEVP